MNNIRTYAPGDLESMNLHSVYDSDPDVVARCNDLAAFSNGPTYSVLGPDGKVIAVMGGVFIFPKVIEVWAVVDKSVEKIPRWYAKSARYLLHKNFYMLGVSRMQIYMRTDMVWAESWAKFLGLEYEGIARQYGAEAKDHYLFSLVR